MRLNATRYFLTFPRTETNLEAILESAKRSLLLPEGISLQWAIAARELHEDGSPHIHVVLAFNSPVRVTSPGFFDVLAPGRHANIQAVRNEKKVLAYVRKDGNTKEFGPVPPPPQRKGPSSAEAAAALLKAGGSTAAVFEQLPGFFLVNKRKVEELKQWLEMKKMKRPSLSPIRITTTTTDPATRAVVSWMSSNIRQPRGFKQAQLFLHGAPDMRKTSLALLAATVFNVYDIPHEEFDDLYYDGEYDLAVLDEFNDRSVRNPYFLNLWLQGAPMTLRVKGSQRRKTDNIPTILISNYSLAGLFSGKPTEYETMCARVVSVDVTTPLDLESIHFEPVDPSATDDGPDSDLEAL